MKLFCILSGIHPSFPYEEILGILEAVSFDYKIVEQINRCLIIEIQNDELQRFVERIAFSKYICKFLFKCPLDLESIKNCINSLNITKDILNSNTFSVRIERLKSKSENLYAKIKSEKLESFIGGLILNRFKKLNVDLMNPDIIFRGIRFKSIFIFGIELLHITNQNFINRSGTNRPYFHPCGLDARIARLFVNLSGAKSGSIIYDPHCGIGTILIEAGLMGYKVIGSDIRWKMIHGSKINLTHYIQDFSILMADSQNMPIKQVNSIVTDPPYGRLTPIEGKSIHTLYANFLKQSKDIIDKNEKIVFASPNTIQKDIKKFLYANDFVILKKFEYYIHKSLTRALWVVKLG
ncbi:MAG: THUMP domain-containing protein [Candidatus Helarchaeota archaeon]